MTNKNSLKKAGIKSAEEAERALDKANKVAAELIGEHAYKVANASKAEATNFMSSLSSAIVAGSAQLKSDGYVKTANLIEKAAGQTTQAEDVIGDFNTAEIANNIQQFIREKPLIAFGGLALAGFVAAAAMQKAHSDLDQ